VFATLTAIERAVARSALDAARARLVAHSGVEAALAQVRAAARHGEDVNANGRLDSGEDADGDGQLDDFLGDVRWSGEGGRLPAFALRGDDGRPVSLRIDGVDQPVSGAFDVSAYARGGDVYTLRIADANAGLWVNEGLGRPGGAGRLRRILNRLGARPAVSVRGLGDRILEARPAEGFRSLRELRRVLSEEELTRAAAFLTVHAWVDPSVAEPVPLSANEDRRPGSPYADRIVRPSNADAPETRIYRFGRGVNAAGLPDDTPVGFHLDPARPVGPSDVQAAVRAQDELNPQWIEVTSRAPVNVNAAPREVLAALIEGVRGFFVLGHSFSPFAADRGGVPGDAAGDRYGGWLGLQIPWDSSRGAIAGGEFGHLYLTEPLDAGEADDLAGRLVAERGRRPFRGWADFSDFIDGLVWHPRHNPSGPLRDPRTGCWEEPAGRGPQAERQAGLRRHAASRARADALLACFNPNLHLNELNPDRPLARSVDKTDLVEASTELCFQPMGVFRIESTGRVLAHAGPGRGAGFRTVAEARVGAVVRLWDATRMTSMKDFWGTDGHEREGEARPAAFLPGDALAEGRGVSYNTNNNRALEIGPEPDNALTDEDLDSLEYDGYVTLATTGGCLPHSAYREGRTKDKWRSWRTRRSNYHPAGDLLHAHFQFDADAHYAAWSAFAPSRDHLRRNFARRHDEGSWEWNFFNYADQPVLVQDGCSPPVRLTWPTHGPYCAVYEEPAGYDVDPETPGREAVHRCGRSFRVRSGRDPERRAYPPQDLRIDGVYVERHSSVAFTAGPSGENFDPRRGAVAYWIKPAFAPEHTATVKKFFSAARVHGAGDAPEEARSLALRHLNPTPFCHVFLPAPSADEESAPLYDSGAASWPSRSFAFGWGFSERGPDGSPWNVYAVADAEGPDGERVGVEGGVVSPCLNHAGHRDDPDPRKDPSGERNANLLAAHRWIHVLLAWDMNASSIDRAWRMWINGRERPPDAVLHRLLRRGAGYGVTAEPFSGDPPDRTRSWVVDDFGNPNPIRIGEPSRLEHAASPVPEADMVACPLGHRTCTMLRHYAMNFVPDSTVDEFYVWGDPDLGALEGLERLWAVGRYYRGGDAWYLAPAVDLTAGRCVPAFPPEAGPFDWPDPGGDDASTPPSPPAASRLLSGSPPGSEDATVPGTPSPRLLALSWTALAGAYDRDRDELRVFDHQSEPPVPRAAAIRAAISTDDGRTWLGRSGEGVADPRRISVEGLWGDGGWSPLVSRDGEIRPVVDPRRVRVALHFATDADPLNSILLDPLILDEFTVFYEPARLEVLEYVAE
jgi:hypothetical protein